jgi:hypothetical protein
VLVAAIAIALSGWLLSNSPIGELRMAAAFVAFGGVLYFIRS